jgi:hypothetical protein
MAAKLVELETRLSRLESVNPTPGAVVIDDISPPAVREGDDIRIRGRNFGMAIGATRVDLNGVPPGFFKTGSGDNLLICAVPAIPGLPGSGAPVSVTVQNQFSSATRQIIVTPAPALGGTVDAILAGTDPPAVAAGRDNLFQVRLRNRTAMGPTLALSAVVSQAAWQPSVTILDALRNPITPPRIHLEPSEEKVVLVRVTIPAGADGTTFTLTLEGNGDGVTASSGPLDFRVGQASDADTSFSLTPSSSSPPGALTGATVTAAAGGITQVNLRADLSLAGDYGVRIDPVPAGATGWTLVVTDPGADGAGNHVVHVLPAEIPTGGNAQRTIQFRVLPAAASAPNAQARLTVQRDGVAVRRTLTFNLIAS